MNERLAKAETLFHAARERAPEEREAFLQQACGEDPDLLREVTALLRASGIADQWLKDTDCAAAEADLGPSPLDSLSEGPGTVVGRYKLLEKIGEGGFGAVYMAEQAEPVHRKVALKIIKLGMDTKSVIARFEAERQALALMDHPNIAKVHDAGATDTGRPYFVMELVRGVPVTRFCEEHQLGTTERLELFIQVCHAVQHAHQKGVIHRDIKPTNVLVTLNDGVPHPMLIDFGVAKALNQRLTEKTLFTNFTQMIGTPAYMSPEQAEMSKLDVDTRSDIYSLGVLLYELLTGTTPFPEERLRTAGYVEMQRIICEEKPPKPSTRATRLMGRTRPSSVALRRADAPACDQPAPSPVDAGVERKPGAGDGRSAFGGGAERGTRGRVRSPIPSDLDWIVMKCLEKDRTRRYETANGLAMDIQRHLNTEPVVARPPSKFYEFQKTVRRHKFGFGATAAIIIVLAAGILVSTWQAVRITRTQREALAAQADEARQRAVAQQALFNWLVGQARTTRLARHSGYRDRVFGLLEKAKALAVAQTNMAVLRDEAVACLGDFAGFTPKTFTFPTNFDGLGMALAPSGRLAALPFPDGTVRLVKMPSGKQVVQLVVTNGNLCEVCFNSTGDQLFALVSLGRDGGEIGEYGYWFYRWKCDEDGRWRESANGAVDTKSAGLLHAGTQVFASATDSPLFSPNSKFHGAKVIPMTFRLFNLETGAFVPGYNVTYYLTNAFGYHAFAEAKSPGGWVIAMTRKDTQGSDSPVTVCLYDWKSGRRINQLHFPGSRSVSLSSDGKYLACFSGSGGTIYTVPGLARIGQFTGNFLFPFPFLTFARNKVALPIYEQGGMRLWNLVTREDITRLDESEDACPVAFSSDGSALLTWTRDVPNRLRLYRLATPEKLDLPPHAAAVPGVAFSPDGTRLASVGKDRVIRVCDATTGRILWQTNDLPGLGQCLGYSPDGRWLATGDFDTDQVWIWDARTGKHLLEIGSKGPGRTWLAQFSPDGRYLATAGSEIRVYRIQRKQTADGNGRPVATLIKQLPVAVRNLVFAPDGRFLTFDKSDKRNNLHLFVWDFAMSSQPRDTGFQVPSAHQTESFIGDGRYLLGLDAGGKIATLKMPGGKKISSFQIRKPNEDTLDAICLSPDGSRLAMVSASNLGVEVWNPKTAQRLYSLPEAPGTVYWLAWSPDGRRLAVARDNGDIAIWNLDTVGQVLTKLGLNP